MKDEAIIGTVAVQQLVPEGSGAVLITPETRVLCIHRGRNRTEGGRLVLRAPRRGEAALHAARQSGAVYEGDYTDTYNSRHYVIAPGYFEVEFGAAQHFKDRAVVPGSRNPETNFQASFIAIIGVVAPTGDGFKVVKAVDHPTEWAPFTDEECQAYEVLFEALDRAHMVDPIERDVKVIDTNSAFTGKPASRIHGGAGSARRSRGTQIEVTDERIRQPLPAGETLAVQDARARSAEA